MKSSLALCFRELAQDTNSFHVEIKTIYGSAVIDRNMPVAETIHVISGHTPKPIVTVEP